MSKDAISGVLNINKPEGLSSQQAVTKVKKILQAERAGHAGTLDPQATGVLVICLEKATKIAPFLMKTTKGYKAQMLLGKVTDTQDSCGKVLKSENVPTLEWAQVEAALKKFEGEVEQLPPMYSALRVKGERLYRLARRGIEVPRQPRKVRIYSLTMERFSSPLVCFSVLCASGTYVRTLCHDVGMLLGCGAHLTALERTALGPFKIQDALTLNQLEDLVTKEKWKEALLPIDEALSFLPALVVKENYVNGVLNGARVQTSWVIGVNGFFAPGDTVRVKSPDKHLLAVGEALLYSHQITPLGNSHPTIKINRVLA